MQLRRLDDHRISEWVLKITNKYTLHDSKDELLKSMALNLLRKIAENLDDTRYFCIMCDDREYLVVCIRWVDCGLEAHEKLIGFNKLDNREVNNTIVPHLR